MGVRHLLKYNVIDLGRAYGKELPSAKEIVDESYKILGTVLKEIEETCQGDITKSDNIKNIEDKVYLMEFPIEDFAKPHKTFFYL